VSSVFFIYPSWLYAFFSPGSLGAEEGRKRKTTRSESSFHADELEEKRVLILMKTPTSSTLQLKPFSPYNTASPRQILQKGRAAFFSVRSVSSAFPPPPSPSLQNAPACPSAITPSPTKCPPQPTPSPPSPLLPPPASKPRSPGRTLFVRSAPSDSSSLLFSPSFLSVPPVRS